MCEWNKYGDTRIDPCMRKLIKYLQACGINTLASCCGHGKYPMSIVVREPTSGEFGGLEIISGKFIDRVGRFYKKDKQDVYRIPETIQ